MARTGPLPFCQGFEAMKFLLAVACLLLAAIARGEDLPTPVILDTDIGTDVDDAYALVLAARRPEIDLVGVTTWNGNVAIRSAIAKKLLRLSNRDDVPVASGRETARDGHKAFWGGWEGKGLLVEGERVEGVSTQSAVELMIDLLEKSDRPATIAAGSTPPPRRCRPRASVYDTEGRGRLLRIPGRRGAERSRPRKSRSRANSASSSISRE